MTNTTKLARTHYRASLLDWKNDISETQLRIDGHHKALGLPTDGLEDFKAFLGRVKDMIDKEVLELELMEDAG